MYQSQSEERIAREKRKRKWRKNAEQHLSHYKIASIPAAAGAGWQWVVCYKHLIHVLRFLDRRKCEAEVFVIDKRGWTRTAKTRLTLTTSLQRSLYIIWKRRGWWRGREKLGIYRILLPPLPRILPCHRAHASWLGPVLVFQRLSTVDYEYTYKVRRNLRALLELVIYFQLVETMNNKLSEPGPFVDAIELSVLHKQLATVPRYLYQCSNLSSKSLYQLDRPSLYWDLCTVATDWLLRNQLHFSLDLCW